MSNGIRIGSRLEKRVRINVLRDVVGELVKGFGVSPSSQKTIEKGIEIEAIKRILINYLDVNNRLVGRVIIDIDWNKHRVLAQSDSGNSFMVDTSRSVAEQISLVYRLLVLHTQKLRQAYSVQSIEVQLNYTDSVRTNAARLNQVRALLDTYPVDEDYAWSNKPRVSNKGLEIQLEYISKILEELKIRIEHNKPR